MQCAVFFYLYTLGTRFDTAQRSSYGMVCAAAESLYMSFVSPNISTSLPTSTSGQIGQVDHAHVHAYAPPLRRKAPARGEAALVGDKARQARRHSRWPSTPMRVRRSGREAPAVAHAGARLIELDGADGRDKAHARTQTEAACAVPVAVEQQGRGAPCRAPSPDNSRPRRCLRSGVS